MTFIIMKEGKDRGAEIPASLVDFRLDACNGVIDEEIAGFATKSAAKKALDFLRKYGFEKKFDLRITSESYFGFDHILIGKRDIEKINRMVFAGKNPSGYEVQE